MKLPDSIDHPKPAQKCLAVTARRPKRFAFHFTAIGFLLGALFCAETQAEQVVNFDGVANDYTSSGSKTLGLPDPSNPVGTNDYIYSFSDTNKISPNTGYTGPAFYGGGWMTSATGALLGFSSGRVRADFANATTGVTYNSQIEMSMTSHAGNAATGASFLAFQTGGDYAIDSTSSLSLTISTGSASAVRFAIFSGSQWYLSSITVVPTAPLGGTLSLSGQAFLESTWAPWDPNGGDDSRLDSVPTEFDVLGSSLTDVKAAGVYTSYNNTASNQYAYLGQFSADLASPTVPEPTSIVLFLSGVMVLAHRRDRRLAKQPNILPR